MVRKILGWILIYALLVYSILTFWPWFDFYPLHIQPADSIRQIPIFLILWWVFWLIYDVIRYVLRYITIPLNALSFWWVHLIINVWVLYLVPYMIELLNIWMTVSMWAVLEVTIMALILSLVGLIIKHL